MNSFITARRKQKRNSLRIDNFSLQTGDKKSEYEYECDKQYTDINSLIDTNSMSSQVTYKSDKNEYLETNQQQVNCSICNSNESKYSFVILSCGHIFHTKCIGELHTKNKNNIIDRDFLLSQECNVCNKTIDTEDMMYIHSKFLKNLKTTLEDKELDISLLNNKLSMIKEELRVHYEHKQKLENERDISKQISIVVSTLL